MLYIGLMRASGVHGENGLEVIVVWCLWKQRGIACFSSILMKWI